MLSAAAPVVAVLFCSASAAANGGEREVYGDVIGLDLGGTSAAVAVSVNGRVEIITDEATGARVLPRATGASGSVEAIRRLKGRVEARLGRQVTHAMMTISPPHMGAPGRETYSSAEDDAREAARKAAAASCSG